MNLSLDLIAEKPQLETSIISLHTIAPMVVAHPSQGLRPIAYGPQARGAAVALASLSDSEGYTTLDVLEDGDQRLKHDELARYTRT
jgi:hypothetical protein